MAKGPIWSDQERELLKEMIGEGKSYKQISLEFSKNAAFKVPGFHKRNPNSISSMTFNLNLKSRAPKPRNITRRSSCKKWSVEEKNILIECYKRGMNDKEIAGQLPGRSPTAIESMRGSMKLTRTYNTMDMDQPKPSMFDAASKALTNIHKFFFGS